MLLAYFSFAPIRESTLKPYYLVYFVGSDYLRRYQLLSVILVKKCHIVNIVFYFEGC